MSLLDGLNNCQTCRVTIDMYCSTVRQYACLGYNSLLDIKEGSKEKRSKPVFTVVAYLIRPAKSPNRYNQAGGMGIYTNLVEYSYNTCVSACLCHYLLVPVFAVAWFRLCA